MSVEAALTLEQTSTALGWPSPGEITHPQGAGAEVYAKLVRGKIGRSLQHLPGACDARLGVLMADSTSATSEPPWRSLSSLTWRSAPKPCASFTG